MSMRIILSRKGFDSSNGGVASPIFPAGDMCSLPIPEQSPAPLKRYGDIWCGAQTLGSVVSDLTNGQLGPNHKAHLDPDLDARAVRPRPPDWHPLFGQSGAAESHLRKQGVAPGDVFLFFGWFRRVEPDASTGAYRYVEGAPDLHCLFGWLQVARRVPVQSGAVPSWAYNHPHWQDYQATPRERPNSVYIASEHLDLAGEALHLPGGGLFGRVTSQLCLTAPGASRSLWQLPSWFHPQGRA